MAGIRIICTISIIHIMMWMIIRSRGHAVTVYCQKTLRSHGTAIILMTTSPDCVPLLAQYPSILSSHIRMVISLQMSCAACQQNDSQTNAILVLFVHTQSQIQSGTGQLADCASCSQGQGWHMANSGKALRCWLSSWPVCLPYVEHPHLPQSALIRMAACLQAPSPRCRRKNGEIPGLGGFRHLYSFKTF